MQGRARTPGGMVRALAKSEGRPVRVYLRGRELTVPFVTREGGATHTRTVPVASFDAVVELFDDGDAVRCALCLPESEWIRLGLDGRAAGGDPEGRVLEVCSSRTRSAERRDGGVSADAPSDAPAAESDTPDGASAPGGELELRMDLAPAPDAHDDAGGRLTIGRVGAVEPLDDWYQRPRDHGDAAPDATAAVARHSDPPGVEYAALGPLAQTEATLAAVFTVAQHAKRTSEDAEMAYRGGNVAEARVFALRRNALYATETVALHRLARADPRSVTLEKRPLDGDEAWCFFFNAGYSFHLPDGAVADELLSEVGGIDDAAGVDAKDIDCADAAGAGAPDLTLDEALEHLAENGLDANEFLGCEFVVDYGRDRLLPVRFEATKGSSSDGPARTLHE